MIRQQNISIPKLLFQAAYSLNPLPVKWRSELFLSYGMKNCVKKYQRGAFEILLPEICQFSLNKLLNIYEIPITNNSYFLFFFP